MAAGRGVSPVQWWAASPAEAIRAEPATVAAAHAGLCSSADAIGFGLRCRVVVPERADENRDGLRCRADTRDTCGLSVGRGHCARLPPDAGLGLSCGQWRADAARFRATGSPGRGSRHARWVLLADQPAPQTDIARGKRRKRLKMTSAVRPAVATSPTSASAAPESGRPAVRPHPWPPDFYHSDLGKCVLPARASGGRSPTCSYCVAGGPPSGLTLGRNDLPAFAPTSPARSPTPGIVSRTRPGTGSSTGCGKTGRRCSPTPGSRTRATSRTRASRCWSPPTLTTSS